MSEAQGKTDAKSNVVVECACHWLHRCVVRLVLFFTPVYDLKYDERHVAVYGMTALEEVAQKLKREANDKK